MKHPIALLAVLTLALNLAACGKRATKAMPTVNPNKIEKTDTPKEGAPTSPEANALKAALQKIIDRLREECGLELTIAQKEVCKADAEGKRAKECEAKDKEVIKSVQPVSKEKINAAVKQAITPGDKGEALEKIIQSLGEINVLLTDEFIKSLSTINESSEEWTMKRDYLIGLHTNLLAIHSDLAAYQNGDKSPKVWPGKRGSVIVGDVEKLGIFPDNRSCTFGAEKADAACKCVNGFKSVCEKDNLCGPCL